MIERTHTREQYDRLERLASARKRIALSILGQANYALLRPWQASRLQPHRLSQAQRVEIYREQHARNEALPEEERELKYIPS